MGVAREVTYLCPYSGPARGVLSVTNYKLHFKSVERDSPFIQVPLGVVSGPIFLKVFTAQILPPELKNSIKIRTV